MRRLVTAAAIAFGPMTIGLASSTAAPIGFWQADASILVAESSSELERSSYPSRNVVILARSVRSESDAFARKLRIELGAKFGRSFIVVNRSDAVLSTINAVADGHTLLVEVDPQVADVDGLIELGYGVYAPRGTPEEIVNSLRREIAPFAASIGQRPVESRKRLSAGQADLTQPTSVAATIPRAEGAELPARGALLEGCSALADAEKRAKCFEAIARMGSAQTESRGIEKKYDEVNRAATALESATTVGVTYIQYSEYLQKLATEVELARQTANEKGEREAISHFEAAIESYRDAATFWNACIRYFARHDDTVLLPLGFTGTQWLANKYSMPTESADIFGWDRGVRQSVGLSTIWRSAETSVRRGKESVRLIGTGASVSDGPDAAKASTRQDGGTR